MNSDHSDRPDRSKKKVHRQPVRRKSCKSYDWKNMRFREPWFTEEEYLQAMQELREEC